MRPILWIARDGHMFRYRWQALIQNWKIARNEKKHNRMADKLVAERLKQEKLLKGEK